MLGAGGVVCGERNLGSGRNLRSKCSPLRMPQLHDLRFCSVVSEIQLSFLLKTGWGFPGGAVVESLPAIAGDTGSSPGLGRSHMPRSN